MLEYSETIIPLDFISCVQTCINSRISSGATSLRDHASSHLGFGGATGPPFCRSAYFPAFDADLEPSLGLKTFLKKGIMKKRYAGRLQGLLNCIRFWGSSSAGVSENCRRGSDCQEHGTKGLGRYANSR